MSARLPRRSLLPLAGAALLCVPPAADAQRDNVSYNRGGSIYGFGGFGNRTPPSLSGRTSAVRSPGVYGFGPVYGGGIYGGGLYGGGFYGNGVYGLAPFGAGFVPTFTGFGGATTIVPYGPVPAVAPGAVGIGYGPIGFGAAGYGGLGYGSLGYGGAGYGGGGYGGIGRPVAVGVGANAAAGLIPTGAVVGGDLGLNPGIAEGLREEAGRWRGAVDLGDADRLPAVDRPATERELADSLKEQRRGDRGVRGTRLLPGRPALPRGRRGRPHPRGEPLYRLAFARFALGDFAEAGQNLRRAVALNPALPTTGPSLAEFFGDGNALARTEAVGRLAEYARADVRDPDRLFLLAAVMHAAGDTRAREIFEAAWRLTGGRPHLRAYLDPVTVRDLEAAPPADDAPALPLPGDDDDVPRDADAAA